MIAYKTYAFPFIRKHWLDFLLILLWVCLLGWIDEAKLSIPVEFWDNVATTGWSLVPCAMVWALIAFALNLREYRTKTTADAALVQEQVVQLQLENERQRKYYAA